MKGFYEMKILRLIATGARTLNREKKDIKRNKLFSG